MEPLPPLSTFEADENESVSPAEKDYPGGSSQIGTSPFSSGAAAAQWRVKVENPGGSKCSEALMSDEELRQVEEEEILAAAAAATSPFSSMSSTQSDAVSTASLHAAQERARHWEVFAEAKDWKRATCALMSCLFSRCQMAHSTVYGRPSFGNMARQRLPSRHVRYIVSKLLGAS